MKIALVFGTRPEIIKLSSIMRLVSTSTDDLCMIHSGQHYSYNMDKLFFEELELPETSYNLEVGSSTHAVMTSRIMERLEPILLKERPDVILVQGDTNTVMAAALTAVKLGIKVGHVEAGLRSYDRTMPEEINRIIADHISDYLFCPTEKTALIARSEGISPSKIFVSGNTIVDAVTFNRSLADKKSDVIIRLGLIPGQYILLTAHRQENVDDETKLRNLLEGCSRVGKETGCTLLYPIHPRSRKMIQTFGIVLPENIRLTDPVGFLDFLQLESNAKIILTDSGGVQEEACILQVPCVTLRENTERPETVETGASLLAGTDPERILNAALTMLTRPRTWKNPFGNGDAGVKILETLHNPE